jgi:hypothetical protein
MSTQQGFNVTLSKQGRDFGTFAGKDGGEVDRDVTEYYPGGMRPARKLFGASTTGDVTVRKLVADLSDDDVRVLFADQQTEAEYTLTQQRLTASDRAAGRPLSQRGNIKTVTYPNSDSASSDAAEIQVVLSMIGTPQIA